ncbi:xanthine dehydrogenase family protein subunit M [Modestobacter sp. I12A-02628]|uniref:Xanthine dehydrogenase family protein subunit M n=1 Tax=Goekera deserti TaxID=2497753 RepID=A0A7K3W8Y9_9ACTN|nr:xanthine dehydrogenase family protein subunit M [Goekera deserti]MPQ98631.1 xanthine dehydrogenase family protein subunit M [Goekera deserti]NDI49193.1 xanthine dehydrogenase family protein subunit M [Goekera deserti]NEL52931.1 xanthine dehydrogenase family protein subunit M [Goekera deserti]
MIPAPFEYVRASSVEEALAALAEHGEDAKLIAGGHSLLPIMKLRLAVPSVLVDISGIRELSYVRVDGDGADAVVAIGALTRHHELETSDVARAEVGLLPHVAGRVGDPQVRHRGTLGGTVAHCDPASDLPTALLALGGDVVLAGPGGRRTVPVTEFFLGFFETAMDDGEMIVELRVPRLGDAGWGYEKFTRRENDWPIVAAAAVAGRDGGAARVALANMAGTVLRATATEQALAGGASIAEAAALAAEGTSPTSDMHADAEYRSHLARLLTRRALETATTPISVAA